MPNTAERYGVLDRTDPRQNIAAGAAYLQHLHNRYAGDLRLVLAAYNAGEAAVDGYGRRVPPFPETRSYVRSILSAIEPRCPRCWQWTDAAKEGAAWGGGKCAIRRPRRFGR